MFNHKKADIVVLGAGAVGLTAAHALADQQIDCVLLDQEQPKDSHSYALALHPETLELLDSLNLIESILEKAFQIQKVSIYEADQKKATLDYSMLPLKYPFLAVISQSELEQILIDSLSRKSHKPLWNHRVRFIEDKGDSLKISVDRLMEGMTGYAMAHFEKEIDKTFEYKANYLIGADGYESTARRIIGIDFQEMGKAADYAVFEFSTTADLPEEMRIIIQGDKTHVYWPLSDVRCRWSFQIEPGSVPAHLLKRDYHQVHLGDYKNSLLDEKHLHEFLSNNAPWFNGTVQNLSWRTLVRFERRLASAFGKGRIWLAGDAAHTTPQASVLSMNVGIREAIDLANRLGSAKTDLERKEALEKYNQNYKEEWRYLFDLDHHISAADKAANWLLTHRSSLIGNIPATGETLTELLAQIHLFDTA
jgi:2-polyprenyl-6-methoxyphenol hydroxylase-like FAD-dependent oxidoreductase